MSVAIRLERADRPERRFVCPECGIPVVTQVPAQKTCLAPLCVAARERRLEAENRGPGHRGRATDAPRLRIATVDTSPTIAAAYDTWRDHHNRCATCGKYDWFDPGAPRLTMPDDIVSSRTLVTADGRQVGVADGPDLAVLCAVGRDRFAGWVRSAMFGISLGRLG